MDSLFLLKKLAGMILMPLALSLSLLVAGTILLWLDQRRRLARYLVSAGCGLLLIFSNPFAGYHLVHHLEAKYPPLRRDDLAGNSILTAMNLPHLGRVETGIHAQQAAEPLIIVLSGGASDDLGLPEADRLTSSSALRVTAAVQIYRDLGSSPRAIGATGEPDKKNLNLLAEPRLVLSGGPTLNKESEALPMERLSESLGVPANNILLETRSKDTSSEAKDLFQFVGYKPFILVTSAVQMPRAMKLFQRMGMHPIPAPANFAGQRTTEPLVIEMLPSVVALNQSTIAMHEEVGIFWERLRGEL